MLRDKYLDLYVYTELLKQEQITSNVDVYVWSLGSILQNYEAPFS